MGKGYYISKPVAVVGIILGVGAISTIIALSVVYAQAKQDNDNGNVLPTEGPKPVTTPAPSNEPWDKYRLPKNLVPDHYNVTLSPRLTPDPETGLYIFTGKAYSLIADPMEPDSFLSYKVAHIHLVFRVYIYPPWSTRI